jgi:hypothetical protein
MNKNLVMPLTAIFFGFAVAFAGYNLLKGGHRSKQDLATAVIGKIQDLRGEVEHQLPRSTEQTRIDGTAPLHEQEHVLTLNQSEATIAFNGGASLRLLENSRLVAERDAIRPDSIIATLLEGDVNVLNPGRAGALRVYKDGQELNLMAKNTKMVPVIKMGPGQVNTAIGSGPGSGPESTPANTIVASTPDETAEAAATPPRHLPAKRSGRSGPTDTLTNEDITRQLRSQTSFFQRCYLTYMNRIKDKSKPAGGGTITVGFTIQSNGKTSGVKVVRSDFQDQTLQKCVTDVVTRTSFKSFGADPIPVLEFPISLQ